MASSGAYDTWRAEKMIDPEKILPIEHLFKCSGCGHLYMDEMPSSCDCGNGSDISDPYTAYRGTLDPIAIISRYNKLVFALVNISNQHLYEEMEEKEQEYADYEMGYTQIVKVARAALADCQESEKITN